MDLRTLRHVPWTCHWGRVGIVVEDLGTRSRVDELFWACHHPRRGPDVTIAKREECERCPDWIEATRFLAAC